jgi:hypothetical protein
VLALAIGLITIDGGFVYDDHKAIETNPIVTGEVPAWEAFGRNIWGTVRLGEPINTYRPLTPLFWRMLWGLSPGSATPFHVASMLLHCGVVLLVLWTARRMGADSRVALFAAMLFAVHATHAEAVGSNVGQADLLATLLGVWAVGICLPKLSLPRAFAGAAVLLVAYLVKESAFIFGGAIILAFAAADRGRPTARVTVLLPILVVTLAFVVFQLLLERSADTWHDSIANGVEGVERFLLGLLFIGRAVQMCLLPVGLAPNHGYAGIDLDRGALIAGAIPGLLLIGALFAGLWLASRRRSPLSIVLLVLLLGPVLLSSNLLVRIPTELPERTYYPALIASSALMSTLIVAVLRDRRAQCAVVAVLVVALGLQSYRVQRPWRNNLALWSYGVSVEPRSLRHQGNLSNALYNEGRHLEAAWHMILAAYIFNSYPDRVDWQPVEALEALPLAQRLVEAPNQFDGGANPCRFVVGSLRVLDKEIPDIRPLLATPYRERYPDCFAKPLPP